MGGALAKCAAEGIKRLGGELFLSSASGIRANKLACELNGNAVTNDFIAANCDLIFIGVKPQILSDMLESIRSTLETRTTAFTMVSMVAGVTLERLRELIGVSCSLIRIMPNTPSSVGAGMIPYCCDGVSDSEEAELVSLMSSSGLWDRLPENLLDAAGCVSGCGPAFLCLALEGMADGGVGTSPRQVNKVCRADAFGAWKACRRNRAASGSIEGSGNIPRRNDHSGRTHA